MVESVCVTAEEMREDDRDNIEEMLKKGAYGMLFVCAGAPARVSPCDL